MTLEQFRDVLLYVTDKVYHYEAGEDSTEQYIVWQETGGWSLYGSDARAETVKYIQVDLFTDMEYDPILEKLLSALEAAGIAFEEPIPSFDKETKVIRYIIECEVA